MDWNKIKAYLVSSFSTPLMRELDTGIWLPERQIRAIQLLSLGAESRSDAKATLESISERFYHTNQIWGPDGTDGIGATDEDELGEDFLLGPYGLWIRPLLHTETGEWSFPRVSDFIEFAWTGDWLIGSDDNFNQLRLVDIGGSIQLLHDCSDRVIAAFDSTHVRKSIINFIKLSGRLDMKPSDFFSDNQFNRRYVNFDIISAEELKEALIGAVDNYLKDSNGHSLSDLDECYWENMGNTDDSALEAKLSHLEETLETGREATPEDIRLFVHYSCKYLHAPS